MKHFPRRASLLITALLAACGGGGGGGILPGVGGGGGGGGTCAAGLSAASGGGSVSAAAIEPSVANEIVMQLRPGASITQVAATFGFTVKSQFGSRPIFLATVASGSTVASTLAAMASDVRVLYAEPNLIGAAPEGRRCSVWSIGREDVFQTQWAPQALRLAEAQSLSQGDGVRVAVLDTGVELTHPLLASRLARRSNGALLGRDFVDDDTDPSERGTRDDAGYGHGTHVAGLVALTAPGARIMPIRVLDPSGGGNVWVLSEALLYAVDPDGNPSTDDGAHIINMSIGTIQPTSLLVNAVRLASCEIDDDDDEDDFADAGFDADRARCTGRRGAAVFAAAGNSGSATEQQYPAAEARSVPGALAVTASTEARRIASFSNFGNWVQVAAPGEGITSAVPGGGYGVWSGTSMASPIAAGVAALVTRQPAPDPQGFSGLRAWSPRDVVKRVNDRTAALCGNTPLRQIDAYAAVSDSSGLDPACP